MLMDVEESEEKGEFKEVSRDFSWSQEQTLPSNAGGREFDPCLET